MRVSTGCIALPEHENRKHNNSCIAIWIPQLLLERNNEHCPWCDKGSKSRTGSLGPDGRVGLLKG